MDVRELQMMCALNVSHAFGFYPSEPIVGKLEIKEKKYPVTWS
jgi:hypothetical protein